MLSLLNYTTLILSLFPLLGVIEAQSSISTSNSTGYTGYNLTLTGDPEDTTYDTLDTPANVSTTYPPPDVYLNASVHIGEIDILVANLSAKINLDAQVLNLLKFNAGVDLSIDRVSLTIQNVTAKVLLEARLENLVLMIDDILHSLDLNPVLATLGQDLTNITNTTIGALTGATANTKRNVPLSYDLAHNILYSTNDYSGNTHRNRLLAQNGDIVDQYLNNDGDVQRSVVVGNYLKDMTFNGENVTTTIDGRPAQQLEFVYEPFRGLSVVSFVWVAGGGGGPEVLGTQVLSERFAGGESSIGD